MTTDFLAAMGLLLMACSSSAPSTSSAAKPLQEPVAATPSSEPVAALVDAAPTVPMRAGETSATVDRFEVGNAGVGLLRDDVEASEETLAALFVGCSANWQRHKGRATPHFQVYCNGLHVMDVVLRAQGRSGRMDYVRIFKEEVGTPSGLGVGSSYQALADLTDNMVCQGIKGGSGGPGVIVHDHTLCVSPLFPRVAYVFRDVVFQTGETPAGADELRIAEVRWTP